MALFRLLFVLLGLGALLCFAAHRFSGDPVWRRRGIELLKWVVVLGLVFFGGLILRRAAVFI